jgi:hypothetical protein
MMRIGQERLSGVAAMAGLANDTAVQPRRRQRRARVAERLATALARCASRGRPGGVIASAQGRLTHLTSPDCDSHQPAGSWRMTPENPITTGG